MAAIQNLSFLLVILSVLLLLSQPLKAHPLKTCGFSAIYQLGDSISDTGNLIRESPIGAATPFARLPYGETFFKKATGRCSNGLLMIDYFALSAGLPLLNPYKNSAANFEHGANFAVAGSTALATHTLAKKGIFSPATNSSLHVQLDWMLKYFDSICDNEGDCIEKLRNSLFMIGEIGGNDYNYALLQGKSFEEVKNMVHDVVGSIKNAVRKVIHHEAIRVIVPVFNNFSKYHNEHLQKAIKDLKKEFPNTVIAYGDYYSAFQWLFHNAPQLGFDAASLQKSCCGIGGAYNFNLTRGCGAPDVPVCEDPKRHISWDGVHLTQEAYKMMAGRLLHDILPQLHCLG